MSDQRKYTAKLEGSRALVIGGSSGIGFTVAEACLEYGALVTVSSSNINRVQAAVEKLKTSYPSAKDRVFGLTVDLSKVETVEDELKTLLEGTVKEMGGKLDHVIFTAGDGLAVSKLEDLTAQKIIQTGQVRFVAPLLLAKFVPTYLNSSYKSTYTIATGSISEKPKPGWSVIASYAGGVHSMVRNLALDLKPIRVNGVSPDVVDTELWSMPQEEKEKMMQQASEKMLTGRPGQPEDVAEIFLAILKDRNMDGTIVRTDGGVLLM
ncbi:NAD(P)-binding protein [Cucurbitaria berberidis CBS 394.84]|uniref:NAD(P)-binding protein n=1 Tax=Cucurbitaria berberidis CBS 394.84 TaxID=1168544 RepID=A0A9P4G6Y7_9PLEO|nr:NAD(P)-binding protein [Cucurbitaria berberidis CBS 394.84]KAF1840183.1 NAD(P)-binding protein [Cucurbitaria berberidis CBS 394.84]